MAMAETPVARVLHHIQKLFAAQRGEKCSDQHLVQRFVDAGDADAFEVLLRRHGPMVLRVCRQVVRHAQDAEDVFQATFLVLARKAAAIRKQASVASWLHGVAYRLSIRARAGTLRQVAREEQGKSVPLMDLPADVTWLELQEGLHEELDRLGEAYGAPLVLCYLEGKTQDEAARQLGWTVGTLRRRLEQGRKLLHARLTRRGLTLPAALMAAGLSEGVTNVAVAGTLVASTVKAAFAFKAGTVISANAALLAERGLRYMFLCKLKSVAALVLTLSVAVGGAGFIVRSALTADHLEKQIAAAQAPAPGAGKPKKDQEPRTPTDSFGDPLPAHALARLGTLRFRVGNNIAAMAVSPQGKTFATVSDNWLLRLYDVETGQELRRFGRVGQGRSIEFTPDGNTLVTTDTPGEGALLLWDVNTGKLLRKFGESKDWIGNVAISTDGKIVAGSSQAHGVFLWDNRTGRTLHVLDSGDGQEGKTYPGPITFSPDGKTVASGGTTGIIYLWDVATGKEQKRFLVEPMPPEATGPVMALAFAPDGKTLVSGAAADAPARIWDVNTGKQIQSLPGNPRGAFSVAFAPDGKIFATAESTGIVRVWDTTTVKELAHFHAHGRPARLGFAKDGQMLVTSGDASIRLWDARTGKEVVPDRGHTAGIDNCFLLSDERTLVTTTRFGDRTVRQWDLPTGKELPRFPTLDPSDVPLGVSPDSKILASRTIESVGPGVKTGVRLSEVRSGKELAVLVRPNMISAFFTPDSKTLFTHSYDVKERTSYVCSWDVATGKEIRILAKHEGTAHNLVLAPDCSTWAFRFPWIPKGADASIFVHDAVKGTRLLQIPLSSLEVDGSFAYSPDSKLLAVADSMRRDPNNNDYYIHVWDIASGKKLRRFARLPHGYMRISYSSDGKTLVTSEDGNSIRLWEVATGGERLQLKGHTGPITSFLFADHGRKLVSTSSDTTALVWDVTGLPAGSGKKIASDPQDSWKALADSDAAKAYTAIWAFTRTPARSVAFLREHLRPIQPVDDKVIAKLVLNLDSPTFAVRQEASAALAKLEEIAEADLRKILAGQPSLELRRRVEQFLEQLQSLPAIQLQNLRAVEALERIGTPEAKELLRTLATGAEAARLTREARASLQRLGGSDDVLPR
jgi:RNA polymerase sigma factor (sigma-70 family)